ncbi:class I SAM-dependent methyltransferase [Robertmurraya andreesenii]|uniref:Site-specific DNA-methyltransferase (Adenine-specific) n=1 Tax=Anoxybacillus andreesenii TaxID=1325932 RepID=A0ABT9V6C6_9BACL|nr:class I SAM-dependent methyltransferase [Robertmurraya andreesenii]MDQ0156492.1 site-specific DNA-methyltransferase (adenine-specific) [Robertmurraya andreesenii]
MKITPVEDLFTVFNQTAALLQEELGISFLEALAETGENIFQQSVLQEEISELTLRRLRKSYQALNIQDYTVEEIRKSFQLAILKGMKESVQPNHQMTPDSIGLLIGYLVNKFVTKSSFLLFDPAVGTGNLLTTVMNQQAGKNVEGIGIDIDDLLIKLAYVNANLQQHPIQLFNQDSLEPLFIELADAVVSDLPVGYYPNDVRAADYHLKADKGHSYAHHLFIEQSMKYTKAGGYLFFLIPNGLFESVEAPKLHQYLQDHAYIQAILQLPMTMFRHENAAKSILILQKKEEGLKAPKQVLLVNLPSLSKGTAVESVLQKIDGWIAENK